MAFFVGTKMRILPVIFQRFEKDWIYIRFHSIKPFGQKMKRFVQKICHRICCKLPDFRIAAEMEVIANLLYANVVNFVALLLKAVNRKEGEKY